MIDIGGRGLHINCVGSGSPTVIVENGGGSFSFDWSLVQPSVAQFVQMCTYDRAGYAWSESAPIRDLPAQIVADFELLLKQADLQPPYILVGQSIGGIYVREYQRRHPEEVVGAVLVDPTHDEGLAYIIEGQPKAITVVSRLELKAFMATLLAKPPVTRTVLEIVPRPYDRLPEAMHPLRLWAANRYALDQDRSRTPFLAEGERQLFTGLRLQRTTQKTPLGKIPLTVLTNGINKQKSELAGLSENGRVLPIAESCHEIQICSPQAVIDAIKSVVDAVRKQ